ncbi:hypothetical protein C8R44DRAFT_746642 [Mycena epipterygia]|nr:hypothetical protein C8R44DRAFT_746642 [Mycena epipterygia]
MFISRCSAALRSVNASTMTWSLSSSVRPEVPWPGGGAVGESALVPIADSTSRPKDEMVPRAEEWRVQIFRNRAIRARVELHWRRIMQTASRSRTKIGMRMAAMTARCLLVFPGPLMDATALGVGNGFSEGDAGEREGDTGEREADAREKEADALDDGAGKMLEASGIVVALEGDLRGTCEKGFIKMFQSYPLTGVPAGD